MVGMGGAASGATGRGFESLQAYQTLEYERVKLQLGGVNTCRFQSRIPPLNSFDTLVILNPQSLKSDFANSRLEGPTTVASRPSFLDFRLCPLELLSMALSKLIPGPKRPVIEVAAWLSLFKET